MRATITEVTPQIRQLLEYKQLTPTQFADLVGVGRPVMSHILSERNKPSLEVVQRLISAFPDISLTWLLSGTGSMLADAAPAGPVPAAASAPAPDPGPPAVAVPLAPAAVAAATGPVDTEPAVATPAEQAISFYQAPPTLVASAPMPLSAAVVPLMKPEMPVGPLPAAPLPAPPPAAKPFRASRFVPTLAASAASAITSAAASPAAENTPAPVAAAVTLPPAPVVGSVTELPLTQPAAHAVPLPAATASRQPQGLAAFLGEPGKAIRRIVIFYQDGSFSDYQPEA